MATVTVTATLIASTIPPSQARAVANLEREVREVVMEVDMVTDLDLLASLARVAEDLRASLERDHPTLDTATDLDLQASLERAPLILLENTTLDTAMDLDLRASQARVAEDRLPSLARSPLMMDTIKTDITDTVTWRNQGKNQDKHVPTCVLTREYKASLFVAAT